MGSKSSKLDDITKTFVSQVYADIVKYLEIILISDVSVMYDTENKIRQLIHNDSTFKMVNIIDVEYAMTSSYPVSLITPNKKGNFIPKQVIKTHITNEITSWLKVNSGFLNTYNEENMIFTSDQLARIFIWWMINYGDVSMQIGGVSNIFDLLCREDLEWLIDWLSEYSDMDQRKQKCIKHILSCLGKFDVYYTMNHIYRKVKSPDIHYSLKLVHVGNGLYRTDYMRSFDSDKVVEKQPNDKINPIKYPVLPSTNKATAPVLEKSDIDQPLYN